MNRLWCFRISGNASFTVEIPGNPTLDHVAGKTTLHHLFLRDEEVTELLRLLEGEKVDVLAWPMVGQTPDQAKERESRAGIGMEERVWPTVKCPSCPWFDPLAEEPCGRLSFPPETVPVLREDPIFVAAERDCPRSGNSES